MSLKFVHVLAFVIAVSLALQNAETPRSQQVGNQSQEQKNVPPSGASADQSKSDRTPQEAGVQILSDTQGVNFGPYLERIVAEIKRHWYELIPESAKAPIMRRGEVKIEFAILKNGRAAGLRIVKPSGDDTLDKAAYGAISGSNPFSQLPSEFRGNYLLLRFNFQYNPEKKPDQPVQSK